MLDLQANVKRFYYIIYEQNSVFTILICQTKYSQWNLFLLI